MDLFTGWAGLSPPGGVTKQEGSAAGGRCGWSMWHRLP